MRKTTTLSLAIVLTVVLAVALVTAAPKTASAEPKTNIIFAEVGWDSIRLHNAVAGLIADKVFGYTWEELSGSTPITHEAVLSGQIDVHMEVWTDNLANYKDDLEAGKLVELGVNFDDNAQGLYVPRYVIEGDAQRGIEASASDLKTVKDLAQYASVFPDPEFSGMGRIFGGIPGWDVTQILEKKVEAYGLTEMYNHVMPGSDAALSAALISAIDRGLPIVSYYWEPTWLMGLYDFVRLEDAPYSEEGYQDGLTDFPSVRITVCVSNGFYASNPEYSAFLANYHTSSALISQALAHMQETGDDYLPTAAWFLRENDELIDTWLTAEQAQTLRAAIAQ